MAFKDLYADVQKLDGHIGTRTLTDLAIKHSDITDVREMWSGLLEEMSLRGFYIEGPLGPPVPIPEHGSLIVLSRQMVKGPNGKHWRHLVYTKELMHVFDREDEKADSEERFDVQIQKFADPTAEVSPQFRAEGKAVWRALLVLCQEQRRNEYRRQFRDDAITLDMFAAAIRVPTAYAHYLLQDNFDEVAAHIMEA